MVLESLKFLSQKTTYAYKVSAFAMGILTKCQYLVKKTDTVSAFFGKVLQFQGNSFPFFL